MKLKICKPSMGGASLPLLVFPNPEDEGEEDRPIVNGPVDKPAAGTGPAPPTPDGAHADDAGDLTEEAIMQHFALDAEMASRETAAMTPHPTGSVNA